MAVDNLLKRMRDELERLISFGKAGNTAEALVTEYDAHEAWAVIPTKARIEDFSETGDELA